MFNRPAFLDRFLGRLPDFRSLRFRILGGVGTLASLAGALVVLSSVQLDNRRCAEVAREHAETLAQTAGLWLDGDAHGGLGIKPESRLEDLTGTLEQLIEASDYPGRVRTLRPKADTQATLASAPRTPRKEALQIVIQTGANLARRDVDYRPEMEQALFQKRCTSVLVDGEIWAFAPIPDSWGATPAMIWVSGPATAPLWRRAAFLVGALLFTGLLVSLALMLARRSAENLEAYVTSLDASVYGMANGSLGGPIALPRNAPSELASLADNLEALRARLHTGSGGQPMPGPMPARTSAQAPSVAAPQSSEACEFDLALLLQQLIEPARRIAQANRIEVQLVFPDGTPSQVVGQPVVVHQILESLLKHSLQVTNQGRVTLRVHRTGEEGQDEFLRFEVADTSRGIGFKEQQILRSNLSRAAQADPQSLRDPLQIASALCTQLGSELSFESQPGQGSRFSFSTSFQSAIPPSPFPPEATGFYPHPTAGRAR